MPLLHLEARQLKAELQVAKAAGEELKARKAKVAKKVEQIKW
jgi:hypothetical protein